MKAKLIVIILMFALTSANGQTNIDALAKSERNFAAYAVAHGIKPAFLMFADSAGIMFDKAKPVNAHELWNSRENQPGILNWRPDYVEIAASHDFGYTTGPWTYQSKSTQDSITARGRFITVWHINKNGEWKFLIDLGVANIPATTDTILRKIEITDPSISAGSLETLLQAENEFISATKQSLKDAYLKNISTQTILNRHNRPAARTMDQILAFLDSSPQKIEFSIDGSGMASSGDLGYVYGSTMINGKPDNFLHIWRKEKQGWKLALEVLHP